MQAGDVVAMFLEETRFASRDEWEQACSGVWDAALTELRTNPGFKGLAAFWADDDTARGGVMGLWDSLEHRLGYEARSAGNGARRSSTPSSSAARAVPGSTSPTPRSTSPPP